MNTSAITVKERQSNMELLRIVAMFIVLVFHTVFYTLYDYRVESPIFASLKTILHIGVPLFILISGYFGIKPSVKGAFKLYLMLLFYNLLFYGFRVVYGDVYFSIVDFANLWFPFSRGNQWWFFKVYFMLYLASPIVNFVKDKMVGGGGKLLIISGVITTYWGWFVHHPSLWDGKNLVNFIFLYMLGHWLRETFDCKDRKKVRKGSIITFLLIGGLVGVSMYFSTEKMLHILERLCWGYNSPILMLMSVSFFMIFTTLDFRSKLVNWVAGSAFAVYCIHENYWFYRDKWYEFIDSQYLCHNGVEFTIIILASCCLLYIAAILLDKVRMIIEKPILPLLDKVQDKAVHISKLKAIDKVLHL